MDYGVVEAVRSLSGQLSDPVEFFGAVCGDFEEHRDSGFDAFRSAFESRGFGTPGEELVRYLDDNGRLELVAKFADHRPEELAAAYREQETAGQGDGVASGQDDPETETAWRALLAEYSGYWDGDEENWAAFEQYVMYYATEQGVAGPAQRFFERAAVEDKPALFAEYGVEAEFGSTDEDTGPDADEDAENAQWQSAIEQFGSAWAAWDGTDEGWAEYRDWFYDATNSQDPAMYAVAYERLDPLNELAAEERVVRLRDLGFDVSGTEGSDEPAGQPDERLASLMAVVEDPAVEGVSREELDQLLKDPDFDQRMADAEALVDAALDEALSEVEAS